MFLYPYGGTWNNTLSTDALEKINVPYHPTCLPRQFEYNDRSSINSIVRFENKQAHLNRKNTCTYTGQTGYCCFSIDKTKAHAYKITRSMTLNILC